MSIPRIFEQKYDASTCTPAFRRREIGSAYEITPPASRSGQTVRRATAPNDDHNDMLTEADLIEAAVEARAGRRSKSKEVYGRIPYGYASCPVTQPTRIRRQDEDLDDDHVYYATSGSVHRRQDQDFPQVSEHRATSINSTSRSRIQLFYRKPIPESEKEGQKNKGPVKRYRILRHGPTTSDLKDSTDTPVKPDLVCEERPDKMTSYNQLDIPQLQQSFRTPRELANAQLSSALQSSRQRNVSAGVNTSVRHTQSREIEDEQLAMQRADTCMSPHLLHETNIEANRDAAAALNIYLPQIPCTIHQTDTAINVMYSFPYDGLQGLAQPPIHLQKNAPDHLPQLNGSRYQRKVSPSVVTPIQDTQFNLSRLGSPTYVSITPSQQYPHAGRDNAPDDYRQIGQAPEVSHSPQTVQEPNSTKGHSPFAEKPSVTELFQPPDHYLNQSLTGRDEAFSIGMLFTAPQQVMPSKAPSIMDNVILTSTLPVIRTHEGQANEDECM
ncbi:hypothetical protein GMRT_14401 [Giardia muris]|uniref:Uncharacterized protein n=1 Tax=Giardia muris TaxID=5742 RepID=A0A4Z1SRA9_GIAMU|nr:hypothetical protein GMRT_14401 [Giardia muris]|eukprot:TNJ28250.1 hypothetical protein GMRT_14401 [Giardia muris]